MPPFTQTGTGALALSTFRLFALVLSLFAWSGSLAAEGRRVALVIGNDSYDFLPREQQLQTAVNDANAMAAKLGGLGFEVMVAHDLDRRSFVNKLYDFTGRLGRDDVALFFFAGHGVNFRGLNYYLPSDIPAPTGTSQAEENRIAENAVSEKLIIQTIQNAGVRVTFAIFDACRDNPLNVDNDPTRALPGSQRLTMPQTTKGVAILYSAAPGQRALDRLPGEQPSHALNSVFTRVLLEQMSVGGRSLDSIAKSTRAEVERLALTAAGHEQRPGYYEDLTGEVFFGPSDDRGEVSGQALPPVVREPSPSVSDPARDWEFVKDAASPAVVAAFLDKHGGDPFFRALAEERLRGLTATPALVTPPVVAPGGKEGRQDDMAALTPPRGALPDTRSLGNARWVVVAGSFPKHEGAAATARRDSLLRAGFDVRIIDTGDFRALRSGYWSVVIGAASRGQAESLTGKVRRHIGDAYAKQIR